ncbi:hypothetical protein VTN49DRAFT_5879 [Thermomyces lanuginosus]|uniref:uncharacterized protein n=1 Tax=Thermomyces lanuginosus TaxID=5541 RepID=UPI0037420B5F
MKTSTAIAALYALALGSTAVAQPIANPDTTETVETSEVPHNLWSREVQSELQKKTQISAPFGYRAGSRASIANLKSKIKRVVWILLENRSFDNMLGDIRHPGLDNPANNGPHCLYEKTDKHHGKKYCQAKKNYDSVKNDPDHSVVGNNFQFYGTYSPDNEAIANGTLKAHNRGFLEKHLISYPDITPQLAAEQVLGYYAARDVPTLVDLVEEYTTFNYWFSCVPGPTNPNRLCSVAGTPDGHGSNDKDFDNSAIPIKSIFEAASEKGITWRNYDGTNGAFNPDALFFDWTKKNAKDSVVPIENFFQDAYLGNLPQLSYINPSCCGLNTNSMHPDGNVSYGEVFVKQIYDALRNGPHWEESLLLVTYDETGGFYDHVPAPLAVRPDDKTFTTKAKDGSEYTLKFDRYGGRMPTWLISPYAPEGHVENYGLNPKTGKPEPYSSTSVLKTLGYLWDIEDFSNRVAHSPSFDHLIGPRLRRNTPQTLTTPKTFTQSRKK